MSFLFQGKTFYPQTAQSHAQDMLNYLNAQLASQGLPQLSASQSNAIWWCLLAEGSVLAINDERLLQASNSLDIANCSDAQILTLLPVAGTELLPATPTTVTLKVTADTGGNAVVPQGSTLTFGAYTFETIFSKTITANTFDFIGAKCTTNGPIEVPAGAISNVFSPAIANVKSVTNLVAGVTGRVQETASLARTRLTNGGSLTEGLDGCTFALRDLAGVAHAKVYFNISTTTALALPGLGNLPARMACVVVNGYSDELCKTYFEKMLVDTYNGFSGNLTQNYTTASGQVLTLNYLTAGTQAIYVKTYVLSSSFKGAAFKDAIRIKLEGMNQTSQIADLITDQEVSLLFDGFSEATVLKFEFSTDGITYAPYVQVDSDSIAVFTYNSTYMPIVNESGVPI